MTALSAFHLSLAMLCATLALACSGRPVPSPVDGEPVCADFEIGATHTKMRGGLHYPVRISIKEGKEPIMKTTIVGLRAPTDTPTRILLPDSNATFEVEWAQCENEWAPRPVEVSKDPKKEARHEQEAKDATSYECGSAIVYKTERIATKKGDLSTHAVHFATPPKTECWKTERPPASASDGGVASPTESAGAGAMETTPAQATPKASTTTEAKTPVRN